MVLAQDVCVFNNAATCMLRGVQTLHLSKSSFALVFSPFHP